MKVLFLSTTSFPFGYSEPLISEKINNLSEFDVIYLFQPLEISNELLYDLPSNVRIVRLKDRLTYLQKIIGLCRVFNKIIVEEIFYSKLRGIKLRFKHLKVMLNSFSIALFNEKILKSIHSQVSSEFCTIYFYSYWCTEATIAAALLKKRGFKMHVFTRMHAYDLYEERHFPNYLPFRKLLVEQLDKTFFISDQGKHYFLTKHFDLCSQQSKFLVIRLGVYKNTEDYFSLSKFNKIKDVFTIVSCSSVIPLKRLHLLIDALALNEGLRLHWIHFGDGVLFNEIYELASKRLANTNVSFDFKGFVLNENLKKFYLQNSVDLFVNTSIYEGLPISIMEAMAYGIPCLATNVGGVSEIINASNGYLLDVNFTPNELTSIITSFCNLGYTERYLMSKCAFETWDEKFNGIKNLIDLKYNIIIEKRQCSKCLFDNSIYQNIEFDEDGVCNVCKANILLSQKTIFDSETKNKKLISLLDKIKQTKNKKYNCLIGLSGGVDSCYVALKAKEWGLNPLILHIDNGWNSELSSMNIEKIIKKTGFDLYTYIINWSEIKDLQLSFFKSSVVDMDLPMDNAIMAIQFKIAKKFGIKYILSGINTTTEGWMPTDFSQYKLDSMNIRNIQKQFGTIKLKTFPLVGPLHFFWYTKVKNIEFCAPLDYIDYNKKAAKEKLIQEFGWRDYGGKHYENIFTKFYQGVILPKKYNFDKRISHLSALIISNQLTKEEALMEIDKPIYVDDHLEDDKEFFIKKLGISSSEFEDIMRQDPVSHLKYKSLLNVINKLITFKRELKKIVLLKRFLN